MLIDTHTHLDFPQFDNDRNEIIKKAEQENILIITSAMGPDRIKKTLEIIEKHDNIFATFGLSPQEFDEKIIKETIALIRKHKDKIVGIGEVGLDYYWIKDSEKRKKEMENFKIFIELSDELKLPLVIHSRDAEGGVICELEKSGKPALMHCFSGSKEQAERAICFGCLISIPTSIIYSKQKQRLAKDLPLESMVLETDAPYLSPIPKTRNEPVNVKLSAEKIAEVKNIDLEVVEETTTKNAGNFFGIL